MTSWLDTVEKAADQRNPDKYLPKPSDRPIGTVENGFKWSFYYLRAGTPYNEAIEHILYRGGDTDTNAAIVGGLLGAAYGESSIKPEWRNAMISFRSDDENRARTTS